MEELVLARRRVQVVNPKGLHMRPADRFVRLANTFQSEIWVDYNGERANGKSILAMTALAAIFGAELDLEATGPDAEPAVAALADLVAAGVPVDDDRA